MFCQKDFVVGELLRVLDRFVSLEETNGCEGFLIVPTNTTSGLKSMGKIIFELSDFVTIPLNTQYKSKRG